MSEPKGGCELYFRKNDATPRRIDIDLLNGLARDKRFEYGPFVDTFGDGYGEPYNPNRQVFGKLKDGSFVYANPLV